MSAAQQWNTTMPKTVDILQRLGIKYGFRHTTYSGAVQDIMAMSAAKVRRLLPELIDCKIELPKKLIVVKLAAAWLVNREIQNRLNKDGQSLLPYSEKLYTRAVNYGKRNAKHYPDAKKRKRKKKDTTDE